MSGRNRTTSKIAQHAKTRYASLWRFAVLLALTNLTETLKNAGITDATAKENTIAALDNGWLPYGEANQRFKAANTTTRVAIVNAGASVGEELHRVA